LYKRGLDDRSTCAFLLHLRSLGLLARYLPLGLAVSTCNSGLAGKPFIKHDHGKEESPMNVGFVLALAFGIGVVAGLRTFTAPAVTAWAAHLHWLNL
jgi:hypothetical protein